MKRRSAVATLLFVSFLLAFPPVGMGDTVQIRADKDNTLYEDETGGLSNGEGSYFFAGRIALKAGAEIRRGLIQFPVAAIIPAGSIVRSVQLTLNMSRTVSGGQTVELHRVLADWGEGASDAPGEEGQGAASTEGDATWIHRFYDTTFWDTPGGDFDLAISAETIVAGVGPYTWGSTQGMVDDAQLWLDNPSANFGWILIGNELTDTTAKRFDSSENTQPSNRPLLVIDFDPPVTSTPTQGASDTSTSTPTATPTGAETPAPTATETSVLTSTPTPSPTIPLPTDTPRPTSTGLPQDFNGDQRVNSADLLTLLQAWHTASATAALDGDQFIGPSDLLRFMPRWQVDNIESLEITEVTPYLDQIEVTNLGIDPVLVLNQLPLCHLGLCSWGIPAGTLFGPGESLVFTVRGMDLAEGDLWVYRSRESFADPGKIVTGLKWGTTAGIGLTAVAVQAGIWPDETAAAFPQGLGYSLTLEGLDAGTPENWRLAWPNLGAFFGTGTAIGDALPDSILDGDVTVELELVEENLVSPIGLVDPDDGSGRLFIYDQKGRVETISAGVRLPEPFLDVSGRVVPLMTGFDERGLLGFALHPGFAANGKVYTYTSEPVDGPADFTVPKEGSFNHQSVIAEWVVSATNPNRIDLASRREILRIDEPLFSHNGGTLRFGPDGLLYASLGDGGGADDQGDGHVPGGNAQEPGNILGSVIRIDVDRVLGARSVNGAYNIPPDNPLVGTGYVEEIYAFGLRNPFMFSFDSVMGDLWLGDVGERTIEEVDTIVSGGNYGWRLKEGSFFFDPNGGDSGFITAVPLAPLPAGLVDPVAEYDHDEGIAVIAGFVYRGGAIPELAGYFVFGEYSDPRQSGSGRLQYLDESNRIRKLMIGTDNRALGGRIKGFGQDRDGEIYVCVSGETGPVGTTGRVFKIVPLP